ncbi:MAG: hypothetical protein EU536_04790, partial [Promethearchaeota archaeon]
MNKKLFLGLLLISILSMNSFLIFLNKPTQTNSLLTTGPKDTLTPSTINVINSGNLLIPDYDFTNHTISWNLTDDSPFDYRGLYSFTNDPMGTTPDSWNIYEPNDTSLRVIDSVDDHHKVTELVCESADWQATWMWNEFIQQTTGNIELWVYIVEIEPHYGGASDSTHFFIGLMNSSESGPLFSSTTWGVMLGFEADGNKINYNVGSASLTTIGTWTPNTWQHYRIAFNTVTDTFDVYQDGVKIGDQCGFRYAQQAINRAYIGYGWAQSTSVDCEVYVDAIDYSWDLDYYLNRNMDYDPIGDTTLYSIFENGTQKTPWTPW